jgi:GntR family transcriptional regulator/MocR family aminotransferase
MAKTPLLVDISFHPRRASETLSDWLYEQLRAGILEGRLKPGTRLPSTRTLARQHHVARGTVLGVFERLMAEGYLQSRVGAGSSVATQLPEDGFPPKPERLLVGTSGIEARISERGALLADSPFPVNASGRKLRAFSANQPALAEFPIAVWSRLTSRRTRLASRQMLQAGDAMGLRPLREAIVDHLGVTRGVVASADQVMIVSSTQQALDLIARLVLDPGDQAWMEDPGYPGASKILRAAGVEVVPVGVDERGLKVAEGMKRAPAARFAYVTPAHQFPLGIPLALERRLALLRWSRENGVWVFEDDYDCEFRFSGRPLAAMQGLDPDGNVIFAGSFSKMLFPSLRMAFVVVPTNLVDPLTSARSLVDRYARVVEQAVLCDFIEGGHFGQHLRRMRSMYGERLEVLRAAAAEHWGEALQLVPTDTGLQTVGWLAAGWKAGWTDRALAAAAAERGIELGPLSPYGLEWKQTNGVQLGFAAVPPAEIRRAAALLGKTLRREV